MRHQVPVQAFTVPSTPVCSLATISELASGFACSGTSASFSFAHDRGFVSYAVRNDLPPAPGVLDAVAPRALLLPSFRLEPELLALARAARQRGLAV